MRKVLPNSETGDGQQDSYPLYMGLSSPTVKRELRTDAGLSTNSETGKETERGPPSLPFLTKSVKHEELTVRTVSTNSETGKEGEALCASLPTNLREAPWWVSHTLYTPQGGTLVGIYS